VVPLINPSKGQITQI